MSTRGQDGQQRFRGMATELRFQTADKFEKEDKKEMRRLVSPVAYQFAAGDVTMPRTGVHAQADAAITTAGIVSLPSKPGVPRRYNPSLRHLPACKPFTIEEVLRHAASEGLSLYRSESIASGYEGVQKDKRGACRHRPFMAYLHKPKHMALGSFATAEEAALCYARARAADPGVK